MKLLQRTLLAFCLVLAGCGQMTSAQEIEDLVATRLDDGSSSREIEIFLMRKVGFTALTVTRVDIKLGIQTRINYLNS